MTRPFSARSRLPGRLRLGIPDLRSRPGLAQALQRSMATVPYVREATASAASGSLLVVYDRRVDAADVEAEVGSHLDRLIESRRWDGARAPLMRVLEEALPRFRGAGRPLALTATAHSLNICQGLTFIASVNVAGGDLLPVLRRLGVDTVKGQLRAVTAISFGLTVAEVWAQYLRGTAWRGLARTTEHRLRTHTFEHLERQDLAFFDDHGTGQLLNLMTGQIDSVGLLVEKADGLFECCITVLVAGGALLKASPGLAAIAVSALPLVVVPANLLGRRAARAFTRRVGPAATLNQALENILSGIVEVKSFTAEEQEAGRVDELSRRVEATSSEASSAALLQSSVVQNVLYLSAATSIGYGSRLATNARLPQTQLIRAVYWIPLMMRAFGFAVHSSGTYYGATAAADRLVEALDSVPTIRSGPTPLPAESVRGEIAFEDVTFGYDPSRPVLRNVSFEIPAGTRLGIVGPNGSRKSTMLRLLLRFYEPGSGRITVDGQDIRTLDIRDLRAAIGLVTQDTYLFDGTIENNVRYGRPDATVDEVRAALEAEGAAELIDTDGNGLSTSVGERGHRLSGGQRQRVAIARALLKAAPILALDEATSQLDYQTEHSIRQRLMAATSGRTVLMIAHRLATVRDADDILVLDRGEIVQRGRHQQLVAEDGLYARLWQFQH